MHVGVQPDGGAVASDDERVGPPLDIVTVVTCDNDPMMTNLSPVNMKYEQ